MAVFTEVARDVAFMRCAMVNVAAIGDASGWILIDAGLNGYGGPIREAAAQRFGGARPAAIVLTHGHFDHVGSLEALLETWDVPVFGVLGCTAACVLGFYLYRAIQHSGKLEEDE